MTLHSLPDDMHLHAENAALHAENAALREENAALHRQIAELERTAATQVQQANDTLDALLNAVQESALVIDTAGTILYANDIVAARIGKPGHTITGMNAYSLLSPDVAAERRVHVEDVIRSKSPLRFEDTRAGKWIDNTICPIFDAAGNVTRLAVFGIDITRRKKAEAALRESERKFRGVITQSPDGINVANEQGVVIEWNRGAEQITGLLRTDVIGRPYWDILFLLIPHQRKTQELYEQIKAGMHHFFATGHAPWCHQLTEQKFQHTNGYVLYAQQICFPIATEHGFMACAIFRDITERVQAEETLRIAYDQLELRIQERTAELSEANAALQQEIAFRRSAEEHYRTLLDTSPDAILVTDLDSTIQFCNPQAARVFGYTEPSELLGKRGFDMIAPEYLATNPLMYVEQIVDIGNIRNIMYTMCRRDGSRFPAEVSSSVVPDRQGCPIGLIIIVHDITKRKEAENQIKLAYASLKELNEDLFHSRNVLRTLFDGLDDGLLLLDHTGTVQAINQAMALLLGTHPDAVVKQQWTKVYPRLAPEFPGHVALQQVDNCEARYTNVRYVRHDGTRRILDIHIFPLCTSSETVEQIIMHVVDVTDQVRLQAQVIDNERFVAGGRLAASVAHEINTPMQALKNSLYLADVAPAEERATYLQYARDEVRRISRIANHLLDLYRPGAAHPGNVAINDLIERVVLLIGKQARDHRVTIEYDFASDLPRVYGRSDELMQVFLNMFLNALDAMEEGGGGKLTITTTATTLHDSSPEHTAVCITIRDTGPGIDSQVLPRIFEPFVTTKEHGTGLGLAISYQIIEQHGGQIGVESQPGDGSTFTILLPSTECKTEQTA